MATLTVTDLRQDIKNNSNKRTVFEMEFPDQKALLDKVINKPKFGMNGMRQIAKFHLEHI